MSDHPGTGPKSSTARHTQGTQSELTLDEKLSATIANANTSTAAGAASAKSGEAAEDVIGTSARKVRKRYQCKDCDPGTSFASYKELLYHKMNAHPRFPAHERNIKERQCRVPNCDFVYMQANLKGYHAHLEDETAHEAGPYKLTFIADENTLVIEDKDGSKLAGETMGDDDSDEDPDYVEEEVEHEGSVFDGDDGDDGDDADDADVADHHSEILAPLQRGSVGETALSKFRINSIGEGDTSQAN